MDSDIRLNRFLARCGLGSRRGCEDFIRAGRVSVNGVIVRDLSVKVHVAHDIVALDGELVSLPVETTTIMLHKPAGCVTTMSDPQGRPCVATLIPIDEYPALFPVGRLDLDTTGLLLFTTDGELGHALLHPRHHVSKTYYALVDGKPSDADLDALREGVMLDDGMTQPARVEALKGESRKLALDCMGAEELARAVEQAHADGCAQSAAVDEASLVAVTIKEGRKRQVKRMFSAIGHPVLALHRPAFGPLSLGDLQRGAWRELTEGEIAMLHDATDDSELGSAVPTRDDEGGSRG